MNENSTPWWMKGVVLAVALTLGTGGWYYFYARHPRVVGSHALGEKNGWNPPVCARVGTEGVLLVSGSSATLMEIGSGKERWSVDLKQAGTAAAVARPAAAEVATTAERAAKLKVWYADLAARRGSLKTLEEISAFNEEAARYQAEAAALKALVVPATPAPKAVVKKTAHVAAKGPAGERPAAHAWEDELIEKARVEKEAQRLQAWEGKLKAAETAAKSPLAKEAAAADRVRYQAALSALKSQQERLAKQPAVAAAVTPVVAVEKAKEKEKAAEVEPVRVMAEEWRSSLAATQVAAGPGGIWVATGNEAVELAAGSGKAGRKVPLPGPATQAWTGRTHAWFLAGGAGGQSLVQTGGEGAPVVVPVQGRVAGARSAYEREGEAAAQESSLVVNDDALVQLEAKLVTRKITERKTMERSSSEDWEKVDKETSGGFGGDALKVAQAMANDAERDRTGGVERVDESTYAVTLSRPMEKGKVLWTGQVTGRPALYALPSVNLVIAGTGVTALEASGKKLWEAKLGYPLRAGLKEAPCGEVGDLVYAYDRAFLTAWRRDSGQVAWRLSSVGIHKVVATNGRLYVCTENGSVKSVQYSQDAHAVSGQPCSILQVSAKDGKIQWNAPKYEDCYVSDGAVYASRVARSSDPAEQVFSRKAPTARFCLFKLSTQDGKAQWMWTQDGEALQVEPAGRKVGVLFPTGFQALTSMAL